ncbi:hypothetical protein AK812_SmicGene7939 [Symbiodinium microadriaticum]|uniref:Uncharacterized protein n=1 Tax=Symbiodinium microadriaticum TaxID=2951 RepID=A0A1Q9EM81_SYMMI|nr:hypothetical protein AK812_SmicGene7939 [Symbiodinium microadriaticum]
MVLSVEVECGHQLPPDCHILVATGSRGARRRFENRMALHLPASAEPAAAPEHIEVLQKVGEIFFFPSLDADEQFAMVRSRRATSDESANEACVPLAQQLGLVEEEHEPFDEVHIQDPKKVTPKRNYNGDCR